MQERTPLPFAGRPDSWRCYPDAAFWSFCCSQVADAGMPSIPRPKLHANGRTLHGTIRGSAGSIPRGPTVESSTLRPDEPRDAVARRLFDESDAQSTASTSSCAAVNLSSRDRASSSSTPAILVRAPTSSSARPSPVPAAQPTESTTVSDLPSHNVPYTAARVHLKRQLVLSLFALHSVAALAGQARPAVPRYDLSIVGGR